MEPFTLVCGTCQSQVRVRNANLIGQLANCPKCQSMLMISRPQPSTQQVVVNSGGHAVDSMAMTKEGIPSRELPSQNQTSQAPPSRAPNVGSNAAANGASSDKNIAEKATAFPDSANSPVDEYQLAPLEDGLVENFAADSPRFPSSSSSDFSEFPEDWQPTAERAHMPSEQWTSPGSARTKQYLMVGFVGVSGVVLAVLLFAAFLVWFPAKKKDNLLSAKDATIPIAVDMISAGDQLDDDDPSQNDVLDSASASDSVPDEAAFPDGTNGDLNGSNGDSSNPPLLPGSNDSSPPANEPSSAPESDPKNQLPVSPLPAAISGGNPSPNDPTAATLEPSEPSLPTQLQAFAPVLSYQIHPQLHDALEVLSEAPVTAEDLGLATVDQSKAIPDINWAERRSTIVPGLKIGPQPLSKFISLWTNISGVPTGIELNALTAANIDRNQNLSLGMVKSTSVGDLAEQLGEPIGVTFAPLANRCLMVTVDTKNWSDKLPKRYPLEGLIEPELAQSWLPGAMVELFASDALSMDSSDWQIADAHLARPTVFNDLQWFEAIRVLEAWRLASQREPTLAGYDAAQLALPMVSADQIPELDHTLTEVVPQSRPVAQIVPRICIEAGLHAWIDWPSVGEIGLGPHTTTLVVTNDRPLRNALANYADGLGLVIAIEDSTSLWITSPNAYRAQTKHFVIPADGLTAQQWKQELRPLTPSSDHGVGSVVVVATPDNQFMLIRSCRPQLF